MDTPTLNKMNEFEKDILKKCAVNVIDVGSFGHYPHNAYCFIRFFIYYDFLQKKKDEDIDRVMLIDGQDSLFQGDPFYEGFTSDMLIFTIENRTIKSSGWAVRVYKRYFAKINRRLSDYSSDLMTNAGITMGGKRTVMAFIEAYFFRFPFEEMKRQIVRMDYVDQAVIHCFIKDGDIQKRYGINVTFSTVDDEYASISLGCTGNKCMKLSPNNYSIGYYKSTKRDIYPFLVHQYDRYPRFGYSYLHACPKLGGESNNYMRVINKK